MQLYKIRYDLSLDEIRNNSHKSYYLQPLIAPDGSNYYYGHITSEKISLIEERGFTYDNTDLIFNIEYSEKFRDKDLETVRKIIISSIRDERIDNLLQD
jgi:hypothetical protein